MDAATFPRTLSGIPRVAIPGPCTPYIDQSVANFVNGNIESVDDALTFRDYVAQASLPII